MSTPWLVAYVVLAAVVVLAVLVLVGTLRRIGAVLEGAEAALRDSAQQPSPGPGGLRPGTPLPSFRVARFNGPGFVSSGDLQGSSAVVLFLSSTCPACAGLARELRRKTPRLGVPLYVVFGSASEVRATGLEKLEHVLVQDRSELSGAFETSTTPHAFAIDAVGVVVAATTPNTFSQLNDFVGAALAGGGEAELGTDVHFAHA
jgi:hypothetical protein